MRSLVALFALSLALPGAAATPTPIPGTQVSLDIPDGFTLSDDFPGIGRDEDLTSILVGQIPAPLSVSREGFTREALAERGVHLRRAVPVEVDGRDALLLHATQRAAGIVFRKWILLLGDDRASVLLTATTPLDLESVHQQALVEALKTATWRGGMQQDARAGLRFRVREVAPLRIVTSAPNAIVLSDPDHDPSAERVAPLVAVGSSISHVQIADLKRFARQRLEQTVSIDEIELESERERSLDGLPGHEIIAVARDLDTRRAVVVTQLLATDGHRYYLLQGIADIEDRASFAPVLEELIGSFALTD